MNFVDSSPAQRICDSSGIRHPHWRFCDPLISDLQIFAALGKDPSLRLLQGTLVILVLKHTSQFRSLGK